jgi:feruloyl esterase
VLPESIVDYYEITTTTMGGPEKTKDFYRLFMVPGMNHCQGGIGAHAIDYLTALEDWVERGVAPEVLIGANTGARGGASFPLDPAAIKFTRPHFAYPAVARYKGGGDPNDSANFEPTPAAR